MAIELGTAYISILPSTDKLAPAIKRELASVEKDTTTSGQRAGSGFVAGLGSAMKTGLKAGALGAIGGASLLGGIGLKTAADAEQAEIAFSTMLGSTKRAKKFLAELSDFAAKTPFDLPGLQKSASSLVSAGISAKDVIPIMTSLGDVTSGMGTGAEGVQRATVALQQMTAAGRITGEDLNQLRDAGIPVYDLLSSATGKSKEEVVALAQAGKLGKRELGQMMEALKSGKGLERFSGLMQKQSKSLSGLFSTLKDNVSQGLAKAVQPAIPLIKQGLGGAIKYATPLTEGLASGVETLVGSFKGGKGDMGAWGQSLRTTGDALKNFGAEVWPAIKQAGNAIKDSLGPAIQGIGDSFRNDFLPGFRKALPVIAPVAKFLLKIFSGAVVGIIKGVAQAVRGFFKILGGLFDLVASLVHGDWKNAWKAFKKILSGALDLVIGLFKVWWNAGILSLFRKGIVKLLTGWKGLFGKMKSLGSSALKAIWNVVKAALSTIGKIFVAGFKKFLGFWKGLFTGIGKLVGAGWTFIKGLWDDAITALRTLLSKFIDVIKKWWSDFFSGLKSLASKGWDLIKQGFSKALDAVKSGFKKAVDGIKKVWDGIKEIAAKPVRFVVDTVYNNGIRKVVNAIPGVPDLPELAFAKGGPVFGGIPGKDSVRAWLMPGEHVLTADEVRQFGGQGAIFRLRELIRKGAFNLGALRKGGDLGNPTPKFASGGTLSAEQIARAQAWAKAQAGKPYIWGGVGPTGFDCSGFLSGVQNVIQGGNGYGTRYGTSGTFPWAGYKPGWGQFTVGAFTGSPGHVAGTLGGMNVESTNGSVRVGSAARGAGDSMFTRIAHLGAGGKAAAESGGFWEAISAIKDAVKAIPGYLSELAHMGGWGGLIKQMVSSVGSNLKDWVNDKIPGPGPIPGGIFDSGGVLEPGTFAYNASRKPEAVLNHRQFKGFAESRTDAGPKRYALTITNWRDGTGYFTEVAEDAINGDRAFTATTGRMRR